MDIMSLTAVELGKKIKAKEISVTEATQAYLDQIEKVENDVHSYVTIDKEGALKRAEEVQKMIDDGIAYFTRLKSNSSTTAPFSSRTFTAFKICSFTSALNPSPK